MPNFGTNCPCRRDRAGVNLRLRYQRRDRLPLTTAATLASEELAMTTRISHWHGRLAASLLSVMAAAMLVAMALNPSAVRAATGPYLVKDINPSGSSYPSSLTAMNGTLYFAARGDGRGMELWRSDGTSSGTRRVKDIRPGPAGSSPHDLAAVAGALYFAANDGVHGDELWVSDGTPSGTRLVDDIRPGTNGSSPYGFVEFNGVTYFAANDGTSGYQLWRTNGTASGTYRVAVIGGGPVLTFAGKLFTFDAHGVLYQSDGTAAGTRPFRDSAGHKIVEPRLLTVVGSAMYFIRNDTNVVGKDRLWRTFGTAVTTRRMSRAEINAEFITGVGRTAFVGAGDIWRTDGTKTSTLVVKAGLYPMILFAGANGTLFFDSDYRLWTSDGTGAGTQPLDAPGPVYPEGESTVLGSILYFAATDTTQPCDSACNTVWRTDGTAAGTYSLGGSSAVIGNFTAVGDTLYWTSNAEGHGFELWAYVP